tara:strand:+ start:1807 stop:4179 length:2373 start_codon:yes stop_codon:yes gene_type:complete
MDELTPEQQQLLNDALQKNVETVEQLKEQLLLAGEAGAELYAQIESGLKNSLGAMMNTATEAEKLLQIAQNSFEVEQQRVQLQETLASNQQKIVQRQQEIEELERKIRMAQIASNSELEASLNIQKETAAMVLSELENQRARHLANVDIQNDSLEAAQARLEAERESLRVRAEAVVEEQEAANVAKDRAHIVENELQQMFGLKDTAGSMADAFIDAEGSFIGMRKVTDIVSQSVSKIATSATLIKTMIGLAADAADRFKKEAIGSQSNLTQLVETAKQFTQATGALEMYGSELRQIFVAQSQGILSNKELGDSYQTLYEEFRTFTDFGPAARAGLTETTAALGRLGVSASVTAGVFDKLSKNFNATPGELKGVTNEMQKFARALGVGPNKMLSDLNDNFNLLAEYGQEKGVQVFQELAVAAKKTGIEMKELVGIAETFDTFEGAATAANGLNVALGGPFLNSMQMHNATISERIQLIQDSMAASGKSFEDMGRMQKKLIADQIAGGDVAKAQALMNKNNVDNIKATTAAYSDQAAALDSVDKAAEKTQTLAQQEIKITEAKTAAYNALGDALVAVQSFINGIKMVLQPFIAIFDLLGATLGGVTSLALGLFAAFKLLPMIMTTIAHHPVMATIIALGYAIAAIATNLEPVMNKLKSFFGFGGTEDKGVTAAGSLGLNAEGGIPGLRYGTDSVSQAGIYQTGENGPELSVLPQGAAVVNNENIQKLKQISMSSGATSSTTTESIKEIVNQVASGAGKDQMINITLKLDSDVLARHTVKVSKETINEVFELV